MSKKIPVKPKSTNIISVETYEIYVKSLEQRCIDKSSFDKSRLQLFLEQKAHYFVVDENSYVKTKKGFKVLLTDKENVWYKLVLKKNEVYLKKIKVTDIKKWCQKRMEIKKPIHIVSAF